MGTHTFTTPGPVHLHVEVGRGSVRVETHAGDTTTIHLEGDHLQDVAVTQEEAAIAVVAPSDRLGFGTARPRSLRVTATVPEGSSAVFRCGSADVRVSGTLAEVAARTGSGDVAVEGSSGRVVVETGSGAVSLARVRGDSRVKSGSGDVHVRELTAAATVRTGTGDLTVDDLAADLQWSTGSGALVVHRARRGTIRVATAIGDVRVGVPPGTPVWTDLTSLAGSVVSHLPPVGAPAEGQDHVEVRGSSAAGTLLLVPEPAREDR